MEKKKILLRLDPKLHEALKRWADEEFGHSIHTLSSY